MITIEILCFEKSFSSPKKSVCRNDSQRLNIPQIYVTFYFPNTKLYIFRTQYRKTHKYLRRIVKLKEKTEKRQI